MTRVNRKHIIVSILGVFFMFGFGYVCPTWGSVTRMGVQYLGILIGWIVMCAFGIPMSMASVMSIAACALPGYYTAATVITGSIGSSFTVQALFIFVLVYVFEESGTGEFLVRWILSRRFINGRPYLFTACFLFAIIVIGSCIGSFGALMITITVLENVAAVTGMKKQDDWIRFLLISVVGLSGITEIMYPFKPYAELYSGIFNSTLASIGTSVSGATYLTTSITIAVISFVLLVFVARFVFKFDLAKIKALDVTTLQTEEFKRIKPNQIVILIAIVISFFHPFIVMLLPKGSFVHGFLNDMGQALFMALVIAVLSLIRIGGRPIMNPTVAFAKGVNWNVIFAVGSVLVVGGGISAEGSGVTTWLLDIFSGTLGKMGPIPVIIIVSLLGCFITQFFSNASTAIILLTALAPMATVMYQNGVNVSVFVAVIGIGTLSACLLPCGSGQSAIMFGTDMFNDSDGQRWALSKGLIVAVTLAIAVMLAGILCISVL